MVLFPEVAPPPFLDDDESQHLSDDEDFDDHIEPPMQHNGRQPQRRSSLKTSDLETMVEDTESSKPASRHQRRFKGQKKRSSDSRHKLEKEAPGNRGKEKDPLVTKSDHGPAALSSYMVSQEEEFGSSVGTLSSFLSFEDDSDDEDDNSSVVCVSNAHDVAVNEDNLQLANVEYEETASRKTRIQQRHRRNFAENARTRRLSMNQRLVTHIVPDDSPPDGVPKRLRRQSRRASTSHVHSIGRSCAFGEDEGANEPQPTEGARGTDSSRGTRSLRRQVTEDGNTLHQKRLRRQRSRSQTQLRRCTTGVVDRVNVRLSCAAANLQHVDSSKDLPTEHRRPRRIQSDGKPCRQATEERGLRRQTTREGRSDGGSKTLRRQRSRSLSGTRSALRRSATVANENDAAPSRQKAACPPQERHRRASRQSSTDHCCGRRQKPREVSPIPRRSRRMSLM